MASKASTRASANKPSSTPAQSSLADAPLLTYKPPTPSQLQSQQNSKERNIKKKRKAKVAVTQDVQVAVANVGLPSSSSSLPDFKQTALDFVKHQANSNTASQTSKVSLTSSSGDSQLAALSSPAILGSTTPAAIAKISSTSIGLSSPNPVPVRTKKKRKKPLAPISTVEPVPDIQEQVTTRELQAAFRRRDVWEGELVTADMSNNDLIRWYLVKASKRQSSYRRTLFPSLLVGRSSNIQLFRLQSTTVIRISRPRVEHQPKNLHLVAFALALNTIWSMSLLRTFL